MKRALLIGIIISALLLFNSCDIPLNEYKPKSDDEKQIIALLNTYADARNKGDLNLLQSTFQDNGVYISNDGIKVPKAEIVKTESEWWVSGGKFELLNPEIKINSKDATVLATEKHGTHFKTAGLYTLVKENGNWLIMKRE
ncbi:MAG: nuclear transport factor 2 family protein [Desulfobacterales bacterium]|jgi:hypothetical protein